MQAHAVPGPDKKLQLTLVDTHVHVFSCSIPRSCKTHSKPVLDWGKHASECFYVKHLTTPQQYHKSVLS
jgi:hypothetical protein